VIFSMHLGSARRVLALSYPGKFRRASHQTWAIALMLSLILPSSCAHSTLQPSIAPETTLLPGAARIWVYREYEPFEGVARLDVRINDWVIGVSEPGDSFFRDVPPGAYNVTVDPVGCDLNQIATVALTAGQTVFVKVESVRQSKLRQSEVNYSGYTFCTRLIPPGTAALELVRSRFVGGG
jgi:hypothetical protein